MVGWWFAVISSVQAQGGARRQGCRSVQGPHGCLESSRLWSGGSVSGLQGLSGRCPPFLVAVWGGMGWFWDGRAFGATPFVTGQGWPVKAAVAGRSQGGRRVGSNGGGEKSYAQVRSDNYRKSYRISIGYLSDIYRISIGYLSDIYKE